MWLKMYLDNLLVDQVEVDLTGRDAYEQRKKIVDSYVDKMMIDHAAELNGLTPDFVLRASSRLNDKYFHIDNDLEKMSWPEVKMYFKLKMIANGNNQQQHRDEEMQ